MLEHLINFDKPMSNQNSSRDILICFFHLFEAFFASELWWKRSWCHGPKLWCSQRTLQKNERNQSIYSV